MPVRQPRADEDAPTPRVVTPPGLPADTWRSTLDTAPRITLEELAAGRRRLVAVAAHPDDETIGAGRLIARWARLVGPAEAIALTAGENCLAHLGLESPGLGARRLREWHGAVAALGASSAGSWGVPDGEVGAHLTMLVERLCLHLSPEDLVVAPWQHDPHPDHAAAGEVARRAAAASGAALAEYPVWMTSWCEPSLLDRTAYRLWRVASDEQDETTRLTALAHYASQRLPLLPGLTPVVPEEMLQHHRCQVVLRPEDRADA